MASGRIKDIIKRLEEGYANQEVEIERLVKASSKQLLDLNKQQLFAGRDSNNKSLGRYKSKWYERFKRMLNPNGVVDLFLTGKFYSRFFIKRAKFPIEIDSKDSKRDKLVGDYGKSIFGLNEESKRLYARDVIKVGLNKYWKKIIQI